MCKNSALLLDVDPALSSRSKGRAETAASRVSSSSREKRKKSKSRRSTLLGGEVTGFSGNQLASVTILFRHLPPLHKLLRCAFIGGGLLPLVHESRFDGKNRARGLTQVQQEIEESLCNRAGHEDIESALEARQLAAIRL